MRDSAEKQTKQKSKKNKVRRTVDMTENNQNNEQPMQPKPLPGQVFIRPGIDDRPDYEKTLTPEAKAALKRLAVKQNPRVPEASNERPETQAARISAESGSPLTAAAHLDVAVPNLESSFLDLRDPMTAPDGTTPTKAQSRRLTIGFALGALLFNATLAALNTVIVPQFLSRFADFDGFGSVRILAWLTSAGLVLSFVMNALIAVASDHSYCRFGRRTPWIAGGSVLAALSFAIMGASDFLPLVVFFWLLGQVGYAMIAMPFAAAFGERVPDKFRDRADSWRGKGQALGQMVGVIAAVALTWNLDDLGWGSGAVRTALLRCSVAFVIAAAVTLLVLPFEGSSSYLPRRSARSSDYFSQYLPPKGAPKFFAAFAARMMGVAATAGITVFQWYMARFGFGSAVSDYRFLGFHGAGSVVVAMAVAAFVGALVAALLLGRIARAFDDLRIPAVAACALFIVAALLPLLVADHLLAVSLYSLLAGFACVVFDGVSQSLGLAILPDVRSVGRSLAAYGSANTIGALLGVAVCAVVIIATGAYLPMFAVAAIAMLLAAVLTLPLKK